MAKRPGDIFINWLSSARGAVKTPLDGKSVSRLPANLALAASLSLSLAMAKRLNAPQPIISMIGFTETIAEIAINGLKAKSEAEHKQVLEKILEEIRAIRQDKIIKLPEEHEQKIEELEGIISAAIVGGVSGGLSSGNVSTSQIATGAVLGALDGALTEVEGFEELKAAIKVANRIFKLTSDPTKFRLDDLKQLKKAYKSLIAKTNVDEEKALMEEIGRDLDQSVGAATNEIEVVASAADVSVDLYNLVEDAFKAQTQCHYENKSDEICEIYDAATTAPIARCERPINSEGSCIIKIFTPIVKDVVRSILDQLNASGISLQIKYCPSAEALNQLISSGAKFAIKPEARKSLIRKYTPPNTPPDSFSLYTLNQLLDKCEQNVSRRTPARKF